MTETSWTVMFVCPHGAGKSRLAAAWFTGVAPPGWRAVSAGVTPAEEVSVHAGRLLAGTAVEGLLDAQAPRPVTAISGATLVVAIDCPAGDVEAAVHWRLEHDRFDEAMSQEIRNRAQSLATLLTHSPPAS